MQIDMVWAADVKQSGDNSFMDDSNGSINNKIQTK